MSAIDCVINYGEYILSLQRLLVDSNKLQTCCNCGAKRNIEKTDACQRCGECAIVVDYDDIAMESI